MLGKAACRRAVEQPAVMNGTSERGLYRDGVEHGLQDGAAADDRLLDAIGLSPRLVIRHAQELRLAMLLDQVHSAAQLEARLEDHVFTKARGVALARHGSERELEVLRLPFRAVTSQVVKPGLKVAANRGNLALPHSLDGWRQLVVLTRDDAVGRGVEYRPCLVDVRQGHRQQASLGQRAKEPRLDVVKDAAARQRIHPLKGLRLIERLKPDRSPPARIGTGTR
jgi:hypothetical protein